MGFADKTGYSGSGFVRLAGSSRDIISDPALYLDARNNTAAGTHDDNAATWTDTANTFNIFNVNGCNWTANSLVIPSDSLAYGHTPEISQGTVELVFKTGSMTYSSNIALIAEDGTVVTDIAPYSTDKRYYIAIAFADTVSVYVDGTKVQSDVDITKLKDINGNIEFSIGIDGTEDTFTGEICSSRVYNRALMANEIRNNYLYDIKRYREVI